MSDVALVANQIRYEQKSYWRNPLAAGFTFLFPLVLFLILVGVTKSSTDTKDRVGRQWWETSHVSANLWTTHGFAPQAVQGWQVGGGINYRSVQPPMNYTGAPAQTASDCAQVQSRTLVDLIAAYRLQEQQARVSMQLNVTNQFNRRSISATSS